MDSFSLGGSRCHPYWMDSRISGMNQLYCVFRFFLYLSLLENKIVLQACPLCYFTFGQISIFEM